MNKTIRSLTPLLCGLCLTSAPAVRAAFPTVYLKPVVLKQIHSPTNILSANDGSGRLFVADQPGKIYVIQGGMMMPTPFLDISNASGGPVIAVNTGYAERGLLGVAFHPGYSNPASPGYRKFYVYYSKTYIAGTDPGPPQVGDPVDHAGVLAEFQVSATNPNVADVSSQRRLMVFTEPQSNHNGGQLEFGPDGYLYFGLGDGGSQQDNNAGHTGGSLARPTNNLGNGQDKTRIFGKIIRIDPLDPDGAGPLTYSIPSSNPFFNDATPGLRKEIYSYGMRNPWRFSFDKRPGGTNRLFCGDVGGDRIEEIDLIVAGGNYGWRYKEGFEFPTFSSGAATNPMPNPGGTMIDPIAMYAHPGVVTSPPLPQLGLSVTGGYVYRGSAIPAMQGKFVFGDYGSTSTAQSWDSRLMGLEETAPNSGVFTLTQAIPLLGSSNPIVGQRILCLGEDEAGEIYVGMKTNAGVLQLDGGLPSGGIYKIVPGQGSSGSTTLTANKDNTIFSEDADTVQNTNFWPFTSDGTGYLYTGRTGGNYGPYNRRALVSFDLSSLPAGTTISSAQLKLSMNKAGPSSGGTSVEVHRLTETWGEGTSLNATGGYGAAATTNDATWSRRLYNTSSWTTAGGTYSATVSATTTIAGGVMTWGSTAQLVSDVQAWVNTPSSNAGWILLGNEVTSQSACRFDSVQQGFTPPSLVLNYTSAPPPTHFESWLATYFPSNFTGQWVDPNGDLDGDGIKNQIEYAFGSSPVSFDSSSGFTTAQAPAAAGATDLTVTFRRDSSATDLTYKLQTSTDLTNWTTIAQSVGGATATGQNGGVVVSDVSIGTPLRLVTAKQALPAGSNGKKFVRLQVDRL